METDCKWGVNFLWIHSRYHFLWQLWHWWTLHNLDLFSYHVFSFSSSKTKMGYRVTPLTHRMSVSYFCFLFFLLLCSFTLLCKTITAQVFKSDQWDGESSILKSRNMCCSFCTCIMYCCFVELIEYYFSNWQWNCQKMIVSLCSPRRLLSVFYRVHFL